MKFLEAAAIGTAAWGAAAIAGGAVLGRWLRKRPVPGVEDTGPTGWHKPPGLQDSNRSNGSPVAPGHNPPHGPGHDCGPVTKRISARAGGCVFVWSLRTGTWEHVYHCGRQDFDTAEWERRLTT